MPDMDIRKHRMILFHSARVSKGLIGALGLVLFWEALRASGMVNPRDLPSVNAILVSFVEQVANGSLVVAALWTLMSWFLGLMVALILGTASGILLGLVPWLERASRPALEFLRPIPSVALIPVALMVLGIGMSMQVSLIVFASIWPILFSARQGVEGIDPRYHDVGRVFGLGQGARILRIVLPAALPSIATGTRIGAAIALALSITVEMLTGRPGLGGALQSARLSGQITEMWAVVFAAGLMGQCLNMIFLRGERWLFPWSGDHNV
ncbi:ABC transporter permease [Roseovarius sp. S4756]|uniref:ABC transporter permease n=1 Tax=Roseovarius maritimus TaxID=3342637 RepID=UPI003726A7B3